MRRLFALWLVACCVHCAMTQTTTSTAKTSAPCSPAITGDSNTVTFTYCGSDPDEVKRIRKLLQAVADGQLTSNTKLDQILGILSTPTPISLEVTMGQPRDPVIRVENATDYLADRITWEFVAFRRSDLALLSYSTQNIGYVKAHSIGPNVLMSLNTLPRAPGGGPLNNGDEVIGTLVVDCPLCRGESLIVDFVWGKSGWFYQVPDGKGRIWYPKTIDKETITGFMNELESTVKRKDRIPIQ
jgi:hypothetical protein